MITRDTKILPLLGEHEEWLQMLLRFGLCCKAKEKTVGDLCASSAFSDDLLLCVLNVLQDKNYRLQGDIQTYALLQLVDYHEREDAFLEKYIEGVCKEMPRFCPLLQCYADDARYRKEVLYPSIVSLYERYYSPTARRETESVDFMEPSLVELDGMLVSLGASQAMDSLQSGTDVAADGDMQAKLLYLRRLLSMRARLQTGLTKSIVRRMEKQLCSSQKKSARFIRYRTHLSIQSRKSSLLSERETECLELISKGLTIKEIASRMGVQPTTVLTHRKHLSEKLQLKTLAELVRYAMTHNIS